jgi:DNA-binding MarR family transcriptional regulator
MSDFGSLSGHLGYLLHRTDVKLLGRIAVALSGVGVSPARATAVVYVALHEGCDQMALGRALGINRASTMKAVNDLVALGAVERRQGRDRRSHALYLTPRGAELRKSIEIITETADANNFSVLTEDEQAAFRAMLQKLYDFEPRKRSSSGRTLKVVRSP